MNYNKKTILNSLIKKIKESINILKQQKNYLDESIIKSEKNESLEKEFLFTVNNIQNKTKQLIDDIDTGKIFLNKNQTNLNNLMENITSNTNSIDTILTTTNAIVKKSKNLNLISKNIDISINAILNGSDKIKLIALNSTIESAKLNEKGKVFAILSNEIRTLSKISSKYISSAKHVIDKVQNSIKTIESNIIYIQSILEKSSKLTISTILKNNYFINLMENSVDNASLVINQFELLNLEINKIKSTYKETDSLLNIKKKNDIKVIENIEIQINYLLELEQQCLNINNSKNKSKDINQITKLINCLDYSLIEKNEVIINILKKELLKNNKHILNTFIFKNEIIIFFDNLKSNFNDLEKSLLSYIEDIKSIINFTSDSIGNGLLLKNEITYINKNSKETINRINKLKTIITQTKMISIAGNIEIAKSNGIAKGFANVSVEIEDLVYEVSDVVKKIADSIETLSDETINIVENSDINLNKQNKEKIKLDKKIVELNNIILDTIEISKLLLNLITQNTQNKNILNKAKNTNELLITNLKEIESHTLESKKLTTISKNNIKDIFDLIKDYTILK